MFPKYCVELSTILTIKLGLFQSMTVFETGKTYHAYHIPSLAVIFLKMTRQTLFPYLRII